MQCPACKNEMIIVEHDRVELDVCIECKGIWLDRGELELLVENNGSITSLYDKLNRNSKGTSSKRCPICKRKMLLSTAGQIELDKCPSDDGIWFDKGELEKVLSEQGFEIDSQIVNFLIYVFGRSH